MDDLLTAVETKHIDEISESVVRRGISSVDEVPSTKSITADSPEALLQLLQRELTETELYKILKCLDPTKDGGERSSFDIRLPSPINGQILQTLVNKTIPEHWSSVENSNSKTRGTLLRCFSSIVGLRTLAGYLQISNNAIHSLPVKEKESGRILALRDVLSFISTLLKPKDFVSRIYNDTCTIFDTSTKQRVAWSEFCSLLSGGKLLSTAAEALSIIGNSKTTHIKSWVGEGHTFSEWLGKCLSYMIIQNGDRDDESFWKSASLMIGRAVGLGYTNQFVHELYTGVIVDYTVSPSWSLYFQHLRHHERSAILQSILRDIQKTYFASDDKKYEDTDRIIGGVATLLLELVKGTGSPQETFRDWLLSENSNFVTTFYLRRALVLLVSNEIESLKELLTQSFRQFGDSFSIRHTILPLQEAMTQVLLLAAGYLHRLQPAELHAIGRSSLYLNGVSNRLAASSTRARFLGMVVGMAISNLVDPPGKAMKFDLQGIEAEEADWYLGLTRVGDEIGSIQDLQNLNMEKGNIGEAKRTIKSKASLTAKSGSSTGQKAKSKIIAIEEISDDDLDTEEDDFIPYAKPDSDASDSEEDPTLVQRVKPRAPMYIRDLVACLKDTENVDRYHLGITNAASLIRRKTGFGTELLENIDGLALSILSLQDNYSLTNFHEYRLQAMIALLVAQPVHMGRFFIGTFFDGDLSQTQRSAILTALGLGARDISGYGEQDAKAMGLPLTSTQVDFPSKKLPSHIQQFYDTGSNDSPVSVLTDQLSSISLQPLALDAADAASGPNALKVRTFSSRMEVERQRQQRETQRKKKIASKDVHKDLTEGIFYPLVARFTIMLQSRSLSNGYNPFYSANILQLFLQTITLVISTLGPHTPALPAVSQETLALIIALHNTAVSGEPIVLPALLSLFLAVIDLNVAAGSSAEERLVTEHGTDVMELREWTNDVFERTPAGTASNKTAASQLDDTDKTRILAAGISVKLGEVIQRYQGRLMGINVGFKY